MEGPIAVVAGAGDLPRQLAEWARDQGRAYVVVQFQGIELSWAGDHPVINAQFERPNALFKALRAHEIPNVVFAGGMRRPKLNPLKFDRVFLKIATTLLPALKSGDANTLSMIAKIFEDNGFSIVGAHDLMQGLVSGAGVLTARHPDETELADIARGFDILRAMSMADVGQSTVVAGGICLGVESIQGSDALLKFVAQTGQGFKIDAAGVYVKGPKQGQDHRMDLPAIGISTLSAVQAAGLGGIALSAGGVMIIDQAECIALADQLGLFIVVVEA
ncbi:hypothetical protein GCM10007939_05090 [Amylibacter marinus]|uniref:UDP-2,3-diacylglucosamine pyrophosphatase LpxI n=1 Tax=Amylibacter marinus TaxID=1475483 RepID=A0ABQ5VSG2_9RHOB|nr:UDP-2,3-diacylglucosamine diphosphatase LpxI [Amylibacter marinus]GLQ34226.1 hypothetical protein GCM10007939_05090 [Amylibacter marinus]